MSNKDFSQFLRNNKLLLPKQPNHDEFLTVMEKVFKWSCLIGVLGSKRYICYFWSTFLLIALIFMEIQAIWKVIKALAGWAIDTAGQRSVTARLAGTIFYTISILSLILASKLYRSWGDLSALWARVERIMTVKAPADRTLKKRMYFVVVFMTVCSILEHLMSIISAIGLDCPPSLIIKRYVLISHGFMILRHEYSDWYAFPLAFMSTVASLLWNFQDQLIVLISMGLTSRYHRLNQCLANICALEKKQMESDRKNDTTRVYTWRRLREAYVKQAMLVRKVDGSIGGIIILSCACNFYFICLQMFLGITLYCFVLNSVLSEFAPKNQASKVENEMNFDDIETVFVSDSVFWENGLCVVEISSAKLNAKEISDASEEYNMKGNLVTELNKKKYDEFLPILNSVFYKARYFGISGFGLTLAFAWCLILFVMLLVIECVAIWRIITLLGLMKSDTGLIGRLSGAIFYANAVMSLFLSSKFMHSWRSLSSYWLRMETNTALDFPPDVKIKKRMIFITVFVASIAVVEHVLSMVSATGIGFPPEEFFYRYITQSHGFVLRVQDYNLWYAIPIFIVSKAATILWNFQDLIIILISMGLSSRYHRLNLYVNRVVTVEKRFEVKQRLGTDLYLQIQVWRRLREAYVRQSTLVGMVDRHLGSLVLLSNVNNLYFICLQIYLGIHKSSGGTISRFYFLFSLGWLIFRACCVVLAASDVHLHSQRALKSLHSCPSASYNVEMKRLQYQLAHDFVALTGMGFFSLRRELLLEVAATILKYELVLIQYDK